jgi:hypothetical protein
MSADERLAQAAQPREQLLAQLAAADVKPVKSGVKSVKSRWQVCRQTSRGIEYPVCKHRWGRVAEWCARRRTRKDPELAVRYNARRAEA